MIIAERVLKLSSAAGDVDVLVGIFLPKEESESSWSCRYEIDWLDGKRTMTAWGVDSVQAMFNALQMIGSEIYTSDYHKSGQLYLDAPGRGYGFPATNNMRDVLMGDDKKFL